jgi:hypothetical protein
MPDLLGPNQEAAVTSRKSVTTSPKEQLEIDKLMVDIQKAKAEINKAVVETARLKSPWYFRPDILQPLAAIAIAVIAAIVGFSNGWFQTKLDSLRNQQERAELDVQKLNDTRADLRLQITELSKQRDELNGKLTSTLNRAEKLEGMYKQAAAMAGQSAHYRAEAESLRRELVSQIGTTKDALKNTDNHGGVTLNVYIVDERTKRSISKDCKFQLMTNHGNYYAQASFDGARWILSNIEPGSSVQVDSVGYASTVFEASGSTEWHIALKPQ